MELLRGTDVQTLMGDVPRVGESCWSTPQCLCARAGRIGVSLSIYLSSYIHEHICIYINIYRFIVCVYVHTHIYIYTYIYINVKIER